jgi:carbonic anhydrase
MKMKRILEFISPSGHYTADACFVWCFDDRFSQLLEAFGKQRGFRHIDLVKVAGGAKALACGPSPERDFVLGQIQASVRLHGTKRVVLMIHEDCGAQGGSAAFGGPDHERVVCKNRLTDASHFLVEQIPDIEIEALFADFNGLYEVAVATPKAAEAAA